MIQLRQFLIIMVELSIMVCVAAMIASTVRRWIKYARSQSRSKRPPLARTAVLVCIVVIAVAVAQWFPLSVPVATPRATARTEYPDARPSTIPPNTRPSLDERVDAARKETEARRREAVQRFSESAR